MLGVVLVDVGLALVLAGAIGVVRPVRLLGMPTRLRAGFDAERFRALVGPGYAKAVMNFRWSDEGSGWTRLVTETRVFATDAATTRRFGVYWRLIYPGSSWIRRAWLAAIRSRAEASQEAGG